MYVKSLYSILLPKKVLIVLKFEFLHPDTILQDSKCLLKHLLSRMLMELSELDNLCHFS